jgi:hypothetical protein
MATSAVPAGGADTGGGGSITAGGSNVPLAAGGAATGLAAGVLGLFAFRRWRRTHLPAA